jgi:hypothetical protein
MRLNDDPIFLYLQELKSALRGSDPAVVMDAVNDATEYLESEVQAIWVVSPEKSREEALRIAVEKFGSPQEVASAFLKSEDQVKRAFDRIPIRHELSIWDRIFGITTDSRVYSALLYLMMSMVTGILYGFWIIYGTALSLAVSLLIIGIPVCLLYLGSVRALTLMESRLVESLLGVRMPRRPVFIKVEGNILTRFWRIVCDAQTWKSWVYLLLMMPLGIVYGAISMSGVAIIIGLLVMPILSFLANMGLISINMGPDGPGLWILLFTIPIAFGILTIHLHLVRVIGILHARIAKFILVGRSMAGSNER